TWVVDLGQQSEGTFQPVSVSEDGDATLFAAGRIEETDESVIYKFDIRWDSVNDKPVLVPHRIYLGKKLGDVVSLFSVEPVNQSLVAFDWTHAAIVYVSLTDGSLLPWADRKTYPKLVSMWAMSGNAKVDPVTGQYADVSLFLETTPFLRPYVGAHAPPILLFLDRGGDGTIDFFGPLNF
ncbi:MAG: hypothetical protein ACE5H3_11140, partial [Planctomycetota bacterium]